MFKKIREDFCAKNLALTCIFTLFFCYFFGTNAVAESHFQTVWPHEKSDLSTDSDIFFGKLPNGFRYVLLENHEPKDRVSMHLNVQAGSMYELESQQGLAHFLEHMLFCGSDNFKPGELIKYFQSMGMRFGPDLNGHTGFYETVYDIILPDGNKKHLEKGMMVIKDFAQGAFLLPSEINRERKVVLSEKRTRDCASYRTFVETLKFEFPDALISKRLPIGMEDVIKNADRRLLKSYYDAWYRPETMILVMVGDFDVELADSLIKEKFLTLSDKAPVLPIPDIGEINHKGIKTFYHFEEETGNATISIEVVKKVKHEADSISLQKKLLVRQIANSIVQNRLDAALGKPDTPFTSAGIGHGAFMRQIEYSEITAKCNPENWTKTLSLLEQTLRKALKYGFTNSELERVKKDFLSELDKAVNQASTRNSQFLARKIIRSLNMDRVFASPKHKQELFAPFIESLTLKNVHNSFKEIWDSEHRLVLLTGNAQLSNNEISSEKLILQAFNKSHRMYVSKPVETKPSPFPYLSEPKNKGKIINKTEISDIGVVQVDFENGIRLNLKKTDFKADRVIANLAFGGGKSSEPSKMAGLSWLSSEVINESGFATLDKEDFEHAMAGKNTRVAFHVGEESFFLNGSTVSNEIDLLFQIFYAYLMDCGYKQDAYNLAMERFSQKYLKLSSSIDGVIALKGRRFLAGGDSRFGIPSYEEFKKLTLDDVKSWIGASLQNSELEISIVGDFDVDLAIESASKYFGSLSLRITTYTSSKSRLPKFPTSQLLEVNVDTKIPKALTIVAYPTEDIWNIHKTRRFSVLASIVSDRLRETVREKLGAAYSPFVYNKPSKAYLGYGVFQAFIHTAPETTNMVALETKAIVSDIIKNGVAQDELKRALGPTLVGIKDMFRTNGYWLNTVLSGSKKHPEQLDWSRTIKNDYASITIENVVGLAKKYLVNEKSATIIVKPKISK